MRRAAAAFHGGAEKHKGSLSHIHALRQLIKNEEEQINTGADGLRLGGDAEQASSTRGRQLGQPATQIL